MTQLQPITEPLHPDNFDTIEITDQDYLLHYESQSISISDGAQLRCASPICDCALQGQNYSAQITDNIQFAFMRSINHEHSTVYVRPFPESAVSSPESRLQSTPSYALPPSECTSFLQSVPIWPPV